MLISFYVISYNLDDIYNLNDNIQKVIVRKTVLYIHLLYISYRSL